MSEEAKVFASILRVIEHDKDFLLDMLDEQGVNIIEGSPLAALLALAED